MNEHDEQVAPDEQFTGDEQHTPSGDAQSIPEPNVDRPEPVADANELDDLEDAPADAVADSEAEEPEAITDLDDVTDTTPADAVADSLKEALGSMREEADRIATLGTGEEQVIAAEQFAEDAGRLDEQVGAAARAADEDER